jgi:hypothetical protein
MASWKNGKLTKWQADKMESWQIDLEPRTFWIVLIEQIRQVGNCYKENFIVLLSFIQLGTCTTTGPRLKLVNYEQGPML